MKTAVKILDYYEKKDALIFFGRNQEIGSILKIIGNSPVTILTGESGSGKTSLLQAGVLARYSDRKDSSYLRPQSLRPEAIEKIIDSRSNSSGEESKTSHLFLLDQFEDLLVAPVESSQWLLPIVEATIKEKNGIKILFSMRSDYLPLFMEWLKPIRAHFHTEQFFYLQRFTVAQAAEILTSILKAAGVRAPHDYINQLARNLSTIDATDQVYPPHLQIVANYICNETGDGERLPQIRDQNDIERVLTGYFDGEIFKGLELDEEEIVREIFDTLVGREGLRRKLTLTEISGRLQRDNSTVQKLLELMINRRIVRHTDENQYELIHDFLSRHFFESFSAHKRELVKLQDMFNWFYRDYQENETLLDEKRLRVILHHLDDIIRTDAEFIFITHSVLLAYSNLTFGNKGLCTIPMGPILIDLYRQHDDENLRQQAIKAITSVMGVNLVAELQELCDNEETEFCQNDLLRLLKSYAPEYVSGYVSRLIENAKTEEDFEKVIRLESLGPEHLPGIKKIIADNYDDRNFISNAMASLRQIASLESYETLIDIFTQNDALRSDLNQMNILNDVLASLKLFTTEHSDAARINNKLNKLVADLFQTSSNNSYFDWDIYFKTQYPTVETCRQLLSEKTFSETVSLNIIQAMGYEPRQQYLPLLQEIASTSQNSSLIEAAFRALGPYLDNEKEVGGTGLQEWLQSIKTKSKNEKIIEQVENLLDDQQPYFNRLLSGGQLNLPDSITPVNRAGGKNEKVDIDLETLATDIIDSLIANQFTFIPQTLDYLNQLLLLSETQKQELCQLLWQKELSEEKRIELACKIFSFETDFSLGYLLDRLSQPEKLHKSPQQFTLFSMGNFGAEPAQQIFECFQYQDNSSEFYFRKLEPEDQESIRRYALSYARLSGVEDIAVAALQAYVLLFTEDPEFAVNIRSFLNEGRFVNLKALAAIALTQIPGNKTDEIYKELLQLATNSPYFIQCSFAMAGLAILNGDELKAEHKTKRLQLLKQTALENNDPSIAALAIELLGSIISKKEIFILHELRQEIGSHSFFSDCICQELIVKIENAITAVKNHPLDRRRPLSFAEAREQFGSEPPILARGLLKGDSLLYTPNLYLRLDGMLFFYRLATKKEKPPIPE